MLRFSCLFLFLLHDSAQGSDVQVEARVRMDPEFMKRMENTVNLQKAFLRTGNSLPVEEPDLEKELDEDILEQILPHYAPNNHKHRTVKEIHEERLEKKGVESIESVAEYLRLKFNFTLAEAIVKECCEVYKDKLKSYFHFTLKKDDSDNTEQHYVILDKVDMAITLQSSLERTLINEVLAKNSNVSKSERYIMAEAIEIFTTRNKQTEMKYICRAMGICRPFPGFTDHLAKVLSEILKLYDVKFQYFIIKSAKLLVSKRSFLEKVLRKEILQKLKEKANNIVDANINDLRESISVLRSVLTERHRTIKVLDEAVKYRTKSTRIILDIIDGVFDKIDIDEVEKRAETVIIGIQDWAANLITDIEPVLDTFITDSVADLKQGMNAVALDETKILVDFIYFGKPTGNVIKIDDLLTKGSKFVNGGDTVKTGGNDFHMYLNKEVEKLLK